MANLELIKKIREITGAGMIDVKDALVEAQEDETKAIEILRKKGTQKAAKKAGRQAHEGVLALVAADKKLAIVGLNCETDFVARNEDFVAAVSDFAKKLLELGEEAFKIWAEDEIKNNLIVKIGENLQLNHASIIEGETIGSYLHSNKKVAGIVVLSGGNEEIAKDIAMHIAAFAPEYLQPEDVPAEVLDKEKEIYTEQLKAEGKPAEIIEKIMTGKIEKFYSEVCLIKQAFVKDDKISIEKLLADNNAKIEKFSYYSL